MSDTFWQRLTRGIVRQRQRSDWAFFAGAEWPNTIMDVGATDRFHAKQGRSTGRWIVHVEGCRLAVYLKRHYRLPWWRGLLALLWPERGWSPAAEEWDHLEKAREVGLPVPASVAVAEYIGPWGRLQSMLAVEELHGMVPLHEAIPTAATSLDAATFRRWKAGLAVELARIVRELHRRSWFHKDLYLCHFYIATDDTQTLPDEWCGRVTLIDLHRLGHHPWTAFRWQAKDLAELLYSSDVAGVDAEDRQLFWRCYLEGERCGWMGRVLLWVVSWKWWLYHRHSERKKRRAALPPVRRSGTGAQGTVA
jgi:heptose I phosphotransferase